MQAGTARNIVASHARLTIETRGATNTLSEYMYEQASRILESAAGMQGCSLELVPMGEEQSTASDAELAERAHRVAQQIGGFSGRTPPRSM